ncbi:probable choline kinase 1 [Sesamum indicum]|uniref:Probable choline kinase 1 n=1 Tax=Sesamum indicum TaxID=4182 RepID=A0A6I9UGJ5_SESIN|nr:probable choline kinase 1 [Sesamum indicum]XP_011100626.1 probable choline kinase 1 [Sesamum indicum]XP_011100632.1 probable choline kinase 1 [Sesamum indicum]
MAVMTNGFLEGSLPEELMQLLLSLASNWGDVIDISTLKVVHLSGAMTNEVYRISWPTNTENVPRTVLVRIYGDGVELFFNRDEEIRTFECLSMHGYGPKLLGQFREGRVEEFIHARTLSAVDLRDPEISDLIAAKMREFHNLDMPGPKNVLLWDRMRNWLSEAKCLCSTDHVKEYNLDRFEKEISLLEKSISGSHQEIGFCHNDLQYGNIMIDEQRRSITIIDYEYASYNPVAYDIANHFCEMAANYHTDTPHILEYSKYPGLEERRRFVQQYLRSAGDEPSDAAIEQLADDVEKYTLANHIFWGLWGLISAYVNHIEFDYKEYARQRFEQYWSRKREILDVKGVDGFVEQRKCDL